MVLGAPPLEEVEEAFLLVALMEEEEEEHLVLGVVVVAQNHHPLSYSVWISLALISVDFQDAFCTKVVAVP